ncbi:MAG: endo-1,4-beta-xylanase [Planctomycetes bacterium]|nr:endo-1,4-beta-xylanase [Planctomycetota bacterium]
MNELAKDITKNLLADDPAIESRIQRGIEENRKGEGSIRLTGADGQAVEKAAVSLRLKRHEFHFGANGFMFEQFKEKEKNTAYEDAFSDLFNLMVVPFYWADTEPEQGKPRFDKNSPYIYRRPPTDLLLEICGKHNITPKGHPLCWQAFVPKWAPLDKKELARATERRIRVIAERYGDRIGIWDVCNEAINHDYIYIDWRVPEQHVEFSFDVATRHFPKSAVLTYNDYACWDYHGEYTPMYMLCRHLKNMQNLNFGAMGLQYHQFSRNAEDMRREANTRLNPKHLFTILDLYGKLGVPINISEITITGRDELGDGAAYQNAVIEKLYRIWFSHPAMNGIIYWNLVDNTAHVEPGREWNENMYKGGLLNFDMTPKASYKTLQRLIKEEWTTNTRVDYEKGGANRFSGFYGDYEVTVRTNVGESKHEIRLSKGSINDFEIRLS